VCLFGAVNSLLSDLIYLLKQQGLLARMATHNKQTLKKTLALLEQEPSTRQNIDSRLLLTYLNQDMLAENEMDVQQ
jgi:hypothetical protein